MCGVNQNIIHLGSTGWDSMKPPPYFQSTNRRRALRLSTSTHPDTDLMASRKSYPLSAETEHVSYSYEANTKCYCFTYKRSLDHTVLVSFMCPRVQCAHLAKTQQAPVISLSLWMRKKRLLRDCRLQICHVLGRVVR